MHKGRGALEYNGIRNLNIPRIAVRYDASWPGNCRCRAHQGAQRHGRLLAYRVELTEPHDVWSLGYWVVRQQTVQVPVAAGHECWVDGLHNDGGGMVEEMTVCASVPNNSVALSAPQLHYLNRLMPADSQCRRSDHPCVNRWCEGKCLSFRFQDHGIGIAFVGLASLLGWPRGGTWLSHSEIGNARSKME